MLADRLEQWALAYIAEGELKGELKGKQEGSNSQFGSHYLSKSYIMNFGSHAI